MTGEITLTGQVLPIGGVREKVLAAQRAGLTKVILPQENEPDLERAPARRRATELEFVLADHVDEVLERRSTAGSPRAPQPAAERQAAASSKLKLAGELAQAAGSPFAFRQRQISSYSRLPRRTNVIRSTSSPWVDLVLRAHASRRDRRRLLRGDLGRRAARRAPPRRGRARRTTRGKSAGR